MQPRIRLALLTGLLTLACTATGHAAVDWEAGPVITTKTPPLASAITLDGKWTFVLTRGGAVQVYDASGALDDTIAVDPAMDELAVSGTGDKIVVSSSRTNTVRQYTVTFVTAIDTKGSPFLGAANAPVEVVVFSDFQCPYCAKVGPLLATTLEHNPGKIKIVYKNFPLPFHKFSRAAAIAGLAAQKQGKFWELHDLLFQNGHDLDTDKINALAKQAGLNMARFKADLADPGIAQRVTQDLEEGQRAGVRGTPTIYVNGRELKHRSPEGLQALIDKELAHGKGR